MVVKDFGKTKNGRMAQLYTIANSKGMEADILDYGGIIAAIRVPFKDGKTNVVLGYEDAAGYENGTEYIGSTVGRTAGQIENAKLELNGNVYTLTDNFNGHNMHGGSGGFSYSYFELDKVIGDNSIRLKRISPDGEDGFPGKLILRVTFTVTEDNAIVIHYDGESSKDTVVDVTNHSYFNLDGGGTPEDDNKTDILSHWLTIDADTYSAIDDIGMPTGEILEVEGTPMDFRVAHQVGERIEDDFEQLHLNMGYDHNWDLNKDSFVTEEDGKTKLLDPCIVLENEARNHKMEVYTDYPGVQFYAGNALYEPFLKRQALCLETQFPTNAPAHPNFPSVVLKAGEPYSKNTVYKFIG